MNQINGPFTTTDQHMLDGLRKKDQRIWRQVYNSNRTKVVSYLRGRGVSEDVALEIYQDTLVFLDTQKETLILTSKLSTYLTGVAIKKLKEHWKKQGIADKRLGSDGVQVLNRRKPTGDDIDEVELALLQLASEDESRFGLDIDESDVLIQKALAQLSLKHCADIFQMRYWDGLNDKQIAAQLKLSHGSLRNQVGDCKKKVKEILLGMGWGQ